MKNTPFTCSILFLISFTIFGQKRTEKNDDSNTVLNKFEPKDEKCYLFIGQDLKAVGGLENYAEGYCNYFDIPFGITTYTNISPGKESYGYELKGNDGLMSTANWGAEDNCAQCYLDDNTFKYSSISIGLSIVKSEKNIAKGKFDKQIQELGNWIKSSNRPIFLRLGYEFDGWEWNQYNKKYYKKAWKRIHAVFKQMQITNVAFVWQSKGQGSNQTVLEDWYPGDELVDWCGYSYFYNPDEEMLFFARKHKKPVFIAEATPILDPNSTIISTKLTNNKLSEKIWETWFVPFFKTINKNSDVIKAISYINSNWSAQPMWINSTFFKEVDSRIQVNEYLSKKWKEEINKSKYIKPSAEILDNLLKN